MPKTEVVIFREESGTVRLVEWLDTIQAQAAERCVVVSHGFVKQWADVPDRELRRALSNRRKFEARPITHAFRGGI